MMLWGGRFGRGAPANGGGGGNSHNAGGGGGSNGDNGNAWNGQGVMCTSCTGSSAWNLDPYPNSNSSGGGRGGYSFAFPLNDQDALTLAPSNSNWGGDHRDTVGGWGGRPLNINFNNRIFFGGGGGAGDSNDGNLGNTKKGGNGGGIVYLISPTVSGSGFIRANGGDALNQNSNNTGAQRDGASGGGGGGTIIIKGNVSSSLTLDAKGGKGGDQANWGNGTNDYEIEGPGGGGGGGVIAISSGTPIHSVNGGLNGVSLQPVINEFPANGATSGADGKYISGISTNFISFVGFGVSVTSNSPICLGQNITLNCNLTGSSNSSYTYSWSGPASYNSNSANPIRTNAQLSHSGNYTVIVTMNGGCTKSATTSVTVNPLPNVNVTSNSPICTGNTLQLNSGLSGSGYTFQWTSSNGFTSSASNPSITNVSTSHSGTYTVTVTASATGCTKSSSTVVVVNQTPSVSINSNSPLCAGQNLSLSATSNMSNVQFGWLGPNGLMQAGSNVNISNVTSSHAGIYTVGVTTIPQGCTNTATTNVVVNPLPNVTASSNSPVCEGQSLQLSSSTNINNASIQWTGPSSFTSTLQNPTINPANLNNQGSYTVTITNPNTGCSKSASTQVNVNPTPTVTITSNSPICEDDNLILNTTCNLSNVNYSWTGPNGFTDSNPNITITGANPSHSGTYSVIVTSTPQGCSNSASANIVVNPLPTVTANSNSPVCVNDNILFNVVTNVNAPTIQWTGPNGFNQNIANPIINNAILNNAGTYQVVVTNPNTGCSNSSAVNVIVNDLPTVVISSNSPLCENDDLQLTLLSNAQLFAWSGPNGFSSNLQNPQISNIQLVNSGTYAVVVTDANQCSNSANTNVIVNQRPQIVSITNNSPICELQNLTLAVLSNTSNVSYLWTGPNGYVSNNATNIIPSATPNYSGNYSITLVDNNNGCTQTASTQVVVNPLPIAQVSINGGNNNSVCEFEQVVLKTPTDPIAVSYQWSGPNGFNGNSNTIIIGNVNTSASGMYQVIVTSNQGCTNQSSTSLVVHDKPVAMYSVDKTSGCQEHCMKFSDMSLVSNDQITSWKWSYNGNEFSQQANPNLCINQAGDYDISLIVTSNYGCTDTLTYPNFIHVFPLPVANFITDNNHYLITDLIQFRDLSSGNNQITQWLWDFGDGNISNTTNPTHSFADTGTYKVSLLVTNNYGCMDTMYTYFYINDDFTFYIPNSFTPNRDMKNDVWNVKGRGIKEYKLEIYNRWGQMIYDTADITEGWNGRLRNSNEIVQNGTYTYKIYVFDKNNQEHYYMGHVNLIR